MNKDQSLGLGIGIIIGGLMIVLMLFFIPANMTRNYQKGFDVGYELAENRIIPETFDSNLCIGYKEGKRICYHYWNETWYECHDDCRKLPNLNERGTGQ